VVTGGGFIIIAVRKTKREDGLHLLDSFGDFDGAIFLREGAVADVYLRDNMRALKTCAALAMSTSVTSR
jgi:hypothetical protein